MLIINYCNGTDIGGLFSSLGITCFSFSLPARLVFVRLRCTRLHGLFKFPFVLCRTTSYISWSSSQSVHMSYTPTSSVPIHQLMYGILELVNVLMSFCCQSIRIDWVGLASSFISMSDLDSRSRFLNSHPLK